MSQFDKFILLNVECSKYYTRQLLEHYSTSYPFYVTKDEKEDLIPTRYKHNTVALQLHMSPAH